MGMLPQAQGRIEDPPFGYREGKDDNSGVLFAFDLVEGKLNPNNYSMDNEEKVLAQLCRRQGEGVRGTELWCCGPAC